MKMTGFTLIEMLFACALSSALVLGCFSFVKVQLHMSHAIHEDIRRENNWLRVQNYVQQSFDQYLALPSQGIINIHQNQLEISVISNSSTKNCFGTPVAPDTELMDIFYFSSGRFMCRSAYVAESNVAKIDIQSIISDVDEMQWSRNLLEHDVLNIVLELKQTHFSENRISHWFMPVKSGGNND